MPRQWSDLLFIMQASNFERTVRLLNLNTLRCCHYYDHRRQLRNNSHSVCSTDFNWNKTLSSVTKRLEWWWERNGGEKVFLVSGRSTRINGTSVTLVGRCHHKFEMAAGRIQTEECKWWKVIVDSDETERYWYEQNANETSMRLFSATHDQRLAASGGSVHLTRVALGGEPETQQVYRCCLVMNVTHDDQPRDYRGTRVVMINQWNL